MLFNCHPEQLLFRTFPEIKKDYTVVYARVSSSQNRSNLKSQAKRLVEFCTANGWVVNEVIEECGSGLNDQRPKLQTLLKNNKVTRLVIEHRDRLTRFGFNYIKTLMKDCEIICVNESTEQDEDLMTDFISIVTCFCARLYGRRRTRRNTEKLIKSLREQK